VTDGFSGPTANFYEEGDPHVAPEILVEHFCRTHGITRDAIGVHPTVLGTFSSRLSAFLAERAGAVPIEPWLRQENYSAYAAEGVTIVTFPVGAPAAAGLMEEIIACGMRSLIVTGAAGSLQTHAPIGTIVLPTSAIREEGTSHHYTPSHHPAIPSPRLVSAIESRLKERGLEYASGPTWTTDAIYMEHRAKIERYRAAGVVTVEMELSALLTIAAYRGVECAGLFAVSDELHGASWDVGFGGDTFRTAMARAALVAQEAVTSGLNGQR
jgi:uridine phosphorylase